MKAIRREIDLIVFLSLINHSLIFVKFSTIYIHSYSRSKITEVTQNLQLQMQNHLVIRPTTLNNAK
jgi:hypothetical protein